MGAARNRREEQRASLPIRPGRQEAVAARDELLTVPLGGTAVGTGINAHPEYAARACGPNT